MLEFSSINNDCGCNSENLQQFSDPTCPSPSVITWQSLQGKPSCFTPCAHTHVPGDIIGLEEYIQGIEFATGAISTNSIQSNLISGILSFNLKLSANAGTGYKVPLSILSDGLIGQIPYATGSVAGILSFSDWNTFNNKFNTPAGTTSQYVRGDGSLATFPSIVATTRQINTSSPLTGGGDLSADRTISIPVATTSVNGYLSSTDWNTFNSKLSNVLTDSLIWVGNASNIPTQVSLSLNASGGTFGLSNSGILTFPNSSSTTRGLLTSADWVIFNNKWAKPSFTTGSVLFWGASDVDQNNSKIFWDNTLFKLKLTDSKLELLKTSILGSGLLEYKDLSSGVYTVLDQTNDSVNSLLKIRAYDDNTTGLLFGTVDGIDTAFGQVGMVWNTPNLPSAPNQLLINNLYDSTGLIRLQASAYTQVDGLAIKQGATYTFSNVDTSYSVIYPYNVFRFNYGGTSGTRTITLPYNAFLEIPDGYIVVLKALNAKGTAPNVDVTVAGMSGQSLEAHTFSTDFQSIIYRYDLDSNKWDIIAKF